MINRITDPKTLHPALQDEAFVFVGKTKEEWSTYLSLIERWDVDLKWTRDATNQETNELARSELLQKIRGEMDIFREGVTQRSEKRGTSEEISCSERFERRVQRFVHQQLDILDGKSIGWRELDRLGAEQGDDEVDLFEIAKVYDEMEREKVVKHEANDEEDIDVQEGVEQLHVKDETTVEQDEDDDEVAEAMEDTEDMEDIEESTTTQGEGGDLDIQVQEGMKHLDIADVDKDVLEE